MARICWRRLRRWKCINWFGFALLLFSLLMLIIMTIFLDGNKTSDQQQANQHTDSLKIYHESFDKKECNSHPMPNIEPIVYAELLPHLKQQNHLSNLNARPLLKAVNLLRSPPEIVLLVPSTPRKEKNYLVETLQNLVKNIAEEERHLVQIVVLLSMNQYEEAEKHVSEVLVKNISENFGNEIHSGLIEMVAPPKGWFPPNMEHLEPTFGEAPDRMRWRTKQCLYYAFAMLHVRVQRPRAKYYLQLEDDIITVPNFVSAMLTFANSHPTFFIIDFSTLGFIGRMFHNNADLAHIAHFILLLHRDQPVDWILSRVLSAKFCLLNEEWAQCMENRLNNRVLFKRSPPLFQHVGLHSSLPGKMQKLKEKNFTISEKIPLLLSQNPPAIGFSGAENLRALYERFVPLRLESMHLLKINFASDKLLDLKALRISYSVQLLKSELSSMLPRTFLQVRITQGHHQQRDITNRVLLLPEMGMQNCDQFVWISDNKKVMISLSNVSSIEIGMMPGEWRQKVQTFTLSAIRVIST